MWFGRPNRAWYGRLVEELSADEITDLPANEAYLEDEEGEEDISGDDE